MLSNAGQTISAGTKANEWKLVTPNELTRLESANKLEQLDPGMNKNNHKIIWIATLVLAASVAVLSTSNAQGTQGCQNTQTASDAGCPSTQAAADFVAYCAETNAVGIDYVN